MSPSASPELTIEVIGRRLPGIRFCDGAEGGRAVREPVHVGIQRGEEVIEAVPADVEQVLFRPSFRVTRQPDGSPNFLGPFAKGTARERFFYLSWGVASPGGRFEMFRRLKVHLSHITWGQIEHALASGRAPRVLLELTDARGGPLCASIRSDRARWELPEAAKKSARKPPRRKGKRT